MEDEVRKSYAGDSYGENDRQVLPAGSDQT